jgi:prepilin-type processing-associated H-X9-DG protein
MVGALYPFSWRVAILPYIEHQALYDQYRFDEPWDSVHNSKLAASMPATFQCPKHKNRRGDVTTAYVALTGPGTLFPEDRPGKLRDAAPLGQANMIALMECPDNRVHWMKPDDLSLDEAIALYSPNAKTPPKSYHTGGCNTAYADGSVHFLSHDSATGELMSVLQTMKDAAKQKADDETVKSDSSVPSAK